jgi:ribosomal protein S18 acetylase RimI-like enzyme
MHPSLFSQLLGACLPLSQRLQNWESKSDWSAHSDLQSDLVIRLVQPDDLGAIAEILASSFHRQDGMAGWFYPLLQLGIREDLRSRLVAGNGRQVCLVAVEREREGREREGREREGRERVVGTVELSVRHGGLWQGRLLYVSNLAVGQADRRRGVAQELMRACERVAKIWGEKALFLHVLENNQRARQLYGKAGYQLYRAEWKLGYVLWGQPRELMLRKDLRLEDGTKG